MEEKLNFLQLQDELLTAIKGKRSSAQMSLRLGFKTNQYHRWESHHSNFTWKEFLLICHKQKLDLNKALKMGLHYSEVPEDEPTLIKHFFGRTPMNRVSKRLEVSASTVSRWMHKKLDLPFEQFLRMAGLSEYSLLNFLKILLPLQSSQIFRSLERQALRERNFFAEFPYLATVLRCFELVRYQSLHTHEEGFISKLLGISLEEELKAVELLKRHNMILKKPDGKFKSTSKQLNTELDFEEWKSLRQYAHKQAHIFLEGLQTPAGKSFWGYKIFSVHPEAFEDLRACYLRFFQELDQITQDYSHKHKGGSDRVMLLNVQLLNFEDVAQSKKNILKNDKAEKN